MSQKPLIASEAPPRTKPSNYPPPFASKMAGRVKRPLGDLFGLRSFGANLTTLSPGAVTALQHVHSIQDEMVFVVDGHPTLILDGEATALAPGMVVGFAAGERPIISRIGPISIALCLKSAIAEAGMP